MSSRPAIHFARRVSQISIVAVLALLQIAAHAQVRGGDVRRDSGPISELSTNVGAGSGPVHERGRSVHDAVGGRLGGTSVRDSVTRDVSSGPVSDVSVGAVTAGQPVTGGETVSDASAGAVTKDTDSPLGAMISEPLSELQPLQERLRAIQPVPRGAPDIEQENSAEPASEEGAEVTNPDESAEPASAPAAEENAADIGAAVPEEHAAGAASDNGPPGPPRAAPEGEAAETAAEDAHSESGEALPENASQSDAKQATPHPLEAEPQP